MQGLHLSGFLCVRVASTHARANCFSLSRQDTQHGAPLQVGSPFSSRIQLILPWEDWDNGFNMFEMLSEIGGAWTRAQIQSCRRLPVKKIERISRLASGSDQHCNFSTSFPRLSRPISRAKCTYLTNYYVPLDGYGYLHLLYGVMDTRTRAKLPVHQTRRDR